MTRKTRRSEQLALDYQRVFATPEGQRVLADLMLFCGVLQSHNERDPVMMARLEGNREVGLRIAEFLMWKPDTYVRDAERVVSTVQHVLRDDHAVEH